MPICIYLYARSLVVKRNVCVNWRYMVLCSRTGPITYVIFKWNFTFVSFLSLSLFFLNKNDRIHLFTFFFSKLNIYCYNISNVYCSSLIYKYANVLDSLLKSKKKKSNEKRKKQKLQVLEKYNTYCLLTCT